MSETMNDEQLAELARLHGAAKLPDTISIRSATIRLHPDGPDICSTDEHEAALAALHNAFPALLHRLREAERERDEAEHEVEELKTNADEYEKDCTKALFAIANECEFEWDGDGATADDLREHISTTLEECTKNEQPLLKKIQAIERERAHLAGEVIRLRMENARQRKLGAAEELERLANNTREVREMYLTEEFYGLRAFSHELLSKSMKDRAAQLRQEAGE